MIPIPKKYFHDRLVLLFLTVNTFLALLCGILVLLRIDSRVNGYIVQYRVNLGINAFKAGGVTELIAFIVFTMAVLLIHTVLSIRTYDTHRHFSMGVLALGTLLIIL